MNVFGHAIGALLTYVFWWHKPLDIDNTVCISLVETGPGVPLWFPLREFIQEELIVAFAAKEVRILGTKDKKGIPGVEAANNGKTLCEDTEYVMCAPDMLSPDQAWGTPKFNVPFGDLNKVKTTIRAVDQGRLTSRNANLDFDPRIAVHRCSMKPTTGNLQSNSFCDPDTRYRGALGRGQATLFWGLLILVSALYGGLHLVAWNAPFASRTQQLLWRISATTVTVSGLPIAIATAAPRNVVKTMVNRNCCALCLYCPILYMWLNLQGALMLSWLLIAFYVFARGYLVVECFISLFHASPGVFNMPNWAAYVPHIS